MKTIAVLVLLSVSAAPQEPPKYIDAGTINGHAYANQCLGIHFDLPSDWAFDPGPAPAGTAVRLNETLLMVFAAHQERSSSHQSLSVFAINSSGTAISVHKSVERTAENFVKDKPDAEILTHSSPLSIAGQKFYRATYRAGGTYPLYISSTATLFRGYYLEFQLSAGSAEALASAANALADLRFAEDQRDPTCTLNPNPQKVVAGIVSSKPTNVKEGSLIRVAQSVSEGMLIEKPAPQYPPYARSKHIEGTVTLRARISTDGTVENLEVEDGDPALAPAALDAVRKWKYKPYLLNGTPVRVETSVTVDFALDQNKTDK